MLANGHSKDEATVCERKNRIFDLYYVNCPISNVLKGNFNVYSSSKLGLLGSTSGTVAHFISRALAPGLKSHSCKPMELMEQNRKSIF